jgi:chromosome segregation ATPase
MARGNEEPRRRLGALQSIFSGGGQALLDQAQSLADEVQRRLAEFTRSVEGQLATLGTALEDNLTDRMDELISRLSVSIRRDVDSFGERLDRVEHRLAILPAVPLDDLLAPLQNLAQQAIESAAATQTRLEELGTRVESIERRSADAGQTSASEAQEAAAVRTRLDCLEQQLIELGREVGTRIAEVEVLSERVGRVETRQVEHAREQEQRAGEVSTLRERLARLEARLSDLAREQVARAVEAAGLRERVFRLEQRAQVPEPARSPDPTVEGHTEG